MFKLGVKLIFITQMFKDRLNPSEKYISLHPLNYQHARVATFAFKSILGLIPSGNFPRVFSQQKTSQMSIFPICNFPSMSQPQRQPVLAAALDPLSHPCRSARAHCILRRLRRPNLTFGKLSLRKLNIWEAATWEIVTWEVTLGNLPLGKCLTPLNLGRRKLMEIYLLFCQHQLH